MFCQTNTPCSQTLPTEPVTWVLMYYYIKFVFYNYQAIIYLKKNNLKKSDFRCKMQCKVTQKKSQCFFLVCPKVRSWALFFSVSTCSHIWAVDIVVYSLNIMEIQYTEQQYSAFETVCHIHNRSWDMSRKMRMTWKVVAFSFLPMQTFLFPELLHRIKICREELISKMLQKTSKVHLMCTHIKCNLQT